MNSRPKTPSPEPRLRRLVGKPRTMAAPRTPAAATVGAPADPGGAERVGGSRLAATSILALFLGGQPEALHPWAMYHRRRTLRRMITSGGDRNPAKLDRGAETAGRRGINPACLSLAIDQRNRAPRLTEPRPLACRVAVRPGS